MDIKNFKEEFTKIATSKGFESKFGGWLKKNEDGLIILELQKSAFGNIYYINIKVFINGVFKPIYIENKELMKAPIGHITKQIRDLDILNFEFSGNKSDILYFEIETLFNNYILPYINKVSTKEKIIEMNKKGELFLLPSIKKELGI